MDKQKEVRTIQSPSPVRLIVRDEHLLVLNREPASISIHELKTGELIEKVPIDIKSPTFFSCPDGDRYGTAIFVSSGSSLGVIDLKSKKFRNIPVSGLSGLTPHVTRDGREVLVKSGRGQTQLIPIAELEAGGISPSPFSPRRVLGSRRLEQIGNRRLWTSGSMIVGPQPFTKAFANGSRSDIILSNKEGDWCCIIRHDKISLNRIDASLSPLWERQLQIPEDVAALQKIHPLFPGARSTDCSSGTIIVQDNEVQVFVSNQDNPNGRRLFHTRFPLPKLNLTEEPSIKYGGFHRLPLPTGCNHMVFQEKGTRVYFAVEAENKILVYNQQAKRFEDPIQVPKPWLLLQRGSYLMSFQRDPLMHTFDLRSGKNMGVTRIPQGVVHASAPRGDSFQGDILLSAGPPGKRSFYHFDLKNKRFANIKGGEEFGLFSFSADGKTIAASQNYKYHNTVVKTMFYPGTRLNSERVVPVGREVNFDGPVFQFHPGPWFAGDDARAFRPKPLNAHHPSSLLSVPDSVKPFYYILVEDTLKVLSLNLESSEAITSFPVQTKFDYQKRFYTKKESHAPFSEPFGRTINGELSLMMHEVASGRVYYGLWDGSMAGLEATEMVRQQTMPRAEVGKPLSSQYVLGSAMEGTYEIMSGPEGALIDSKGKISWTPRPDQTGKQAFKVRARVAGKSSFPRFTINVMGAGNVAQSSATAPDWLEANESSPSHVEWKTESKAVRIVARPGGKGSILQIGKTLNWLDQSGSRILDSKQTPETLTDFFVTENFIVGTRGKLIEVFDPSSMRAVRRISFPYEVRDLAGIPGTEKGYATLKWPTLLQAENESELTKPLLLIDTSKDLAKPLRDWTADYVVVSHDGSFIATSATIDLLELEAENLTTRNSINSRIHVDSLMTGRLGPSGQLTPIGIKIAPGTTLRSLKISGDNQEVSYTGSVVAGYKMLDPEDIPQLYKTKNPLDCADHPSLNVKAVATGSRLILFNRKTGTELELKPLSFTGRTSINAVEFSADGSRILIKNINPKGQEVLTSMPFPVDEVMREVGRVNTLEPPSIAAILAGPQDFGQSRLQKALPMTMALLKASVQKESQKQPKAIIDQRVAPAVVRVVSSKGNGTGFLVSSKGHVLTCQHLLAKGEAPVVHYLDVNGNMVKRAGYVLSASAEQNLALIAIAADGELPFVRFELSDHLEMGEEIYQLGHPGIGEATFDFSMSEGIISSPRRVLGGSAFIQTSIRTNPGMEGAPLLNSRGNAVGILSKDQGIDAVGFAVPSRDILLFLKKNCQ